MLQWAAPADRTGECRASRGSSWGKRAAPDLDGQRRTLTGELPSGVGSAAPRPESFRAGGGSAGKYEKLLKATWSAVVLGHDPSNSIKSPSRSFCRQDGSSRCSLQQPPKAASRRRSCWGMFGPQQLNQQSPFRGGWAVRALEIEESGPVPDLRKQHQPCNIIWISSARPIEDREVCIIYFLDWCTHDMQFHSVSVIVEGDIFFTTRLPSSLWSLFELIFI